MNLSLFALFALFPAMIGPLQGHRQDTVVAQLCNGGSITIPFGKGKDKPEIPCSAKGCHAGNCRKSLIERNDEGGEDAD